ncbi:hypothetical protein AYJ08_20190 [Brevibacillus sp. SKDU10]|uniref:hypothetical protein n=1 Tax=Brevibacillus sp. SKDU10 TaxID=1247872 RepID=UPI0007C9211F|nr:hypothetical protein [Brevibacillus sp. SKDU10]OAJ76120.1 hypothetical protein AYJ08_20190 [Brevibacillus sp. SKDU10]
MGNKLAYLHTSVFQGPLIPVKVLEETDFEIYTVVKHHESEQHYLHYQTCHLDLMAGGNHETYEFYLPLSTDQVVGLLFGEEAYHYPECWRTAYWRTGKDDRLLAFDPTENFLNEEEARAERALLDSLRQYKQLFASAADKEALTKYYFPQWDQQKKNQ